MIITMYLKFLCDTVTLSTLCLFYTMSYFRKMYVLKTGFHMRITTATYCSTGNAGISVHLNAAVPATEITIF